MLILRRNKGLFIYTRKVVVLPSETRLIDGWTYRAEVLDKPNHNSLAYGRVPKGNLIIFDICTGEERYLPRYQKMTEAFRLGLECVPALDFTGNFTLSLLKRFLEHTSILGNTKIEGVVIKPFDYSLFGRDGKCIFAKYVSEAFKEKNSKNWKKENPSSKDVLQSLAETFISERRWEKAVERLRDQDVLSQSPQDIGKLIKAIQQDALVEAEEEVKLRLWSWAKDAIKRKCTHGFPEWYKNKLIKDQQERLHES